MCNGYDSRSVLIKKPVKALAASMLDKHARGAFIRSYVKIAQDESRQRGARNKGEK